METFETNFLAEEWYDFLKETVEPEFPGIHFEIYSPKPDPEYTTMKYADRVAVIIDKKAMFKFRLKGSLINNHTVKTSLANYVQRTHKKMMVER